jgi:hypothetical protein
LSKKKLFIPNKKIGLIIYYGKQSSTPEEKACAVDKAQNKEHTQHNIFIATRRRHVSTTAPFSKLKTPPTTAFTHDGESSSFSSHYFSQPNHTFLSSNPFQRISTFLKPPSLLNRGHITTHQQRPNFYSFFHHPIAFHNLGRTHFL